MHKRTLLYTDSHGINYIYKLGPKANRLRVSGDPVSIDSLYPVDTTLTLIPMAKVESSHYPVKPVVIKGQRVDDLIVFVDENFLPYVGSNVTYGNYWPRVTGIEREMWLARLENWIGYYEPVATAYV